MASPPVPARRLDYLPVADVAHALVNPKDHDEPLIASSIDRFGFLEPIVLDERTQRLVAGHGRANDLVRREAAGETPPAGVEVDDDGGAWLVPVVRGWASANDAEAHAAGIALNRIGESGGWRDDALVDVLDVIAALPDGLTGVGFDEVDLDDLRASLSPPLTLDDMEHKYGEHTPESLWPVIRLQVPPDVHERYVSIMATMGDDDEPARFARLLDAAAAGT